MSLLEALTPTGSFCLTMGSWGNGTLRALGPQDDASALPGVCFGAGGKSTPAVGGTGPQPVGAQAHFLCQGRVASGSASLLPTAPPSRPLLPVFPRSTDCPVHRAEVLGSYFSALFLSLIFSLP